jgi:hypothetical protein
VAALVVHPVETGCQHERHGVHRQHVSVLEATLAKVSSSGAKEHAKNVVVRRFSKWQSVPTNIKYYFQILSGENVALSPLVLLATEELKSTALCKTIQPPIVLSRFLRPRRADD